MEQIAIVGRSCHDLLNPVDTFMRELAELAEEFQELLQPIEEAITSAAAWLAEMERKMQEFMDMMTESDAAKCTLEIFEPITDTINLVSCPIDEALGALMHTLTDNLITSVEGVLTAAYNNGLITFVDLLVPDGLNIEIPDLTMSLPTAEWTTRFNAFCPAASLAFPQLETTLGAVANMDLPYRLTGADIEELILDEALAEIPTEIGDYESACATAWEEMGSDYQHCQTLLNKAADIAMEAACPLLEETYQIAVGLVDVKQADYDAALRSFE